MNLYFSPVTEITWSDMLGRVAKAEARLARWERKQWRTWARHPLGKLWNQSSAFTQKSLLVCMQTLHRLEQDRFVLGARKILLSAAKIVQNDGLKFTIILTILGYALWCINHF